MATTHHPPVPSSSPEKLINTREAAALPWLQMQGKPMRVTTIYRWIHLGVKGRKLRTVSIGGAFATTEEWLRDFCGFNAPGAPPEKTKRQRDRIADAALDRLGV